MKSKQVSGVLLAATVVVMTAAPAVAYAPQAPIAAGSFESILEVIPVARKCGVMQLRLDALEISDQDEARLYLMDVPSDNAMSCLSRWLTENGKRLKLLPRWYEDDFTSDRP